MTLILTLKFFPLRVFGFFKSVFLDTKGKKSASKKLGYMGSIKTGITGLSPV